MTHSGSAIIGFWLKRVHVRYRAKEGGCDSMVAHGVLCVQEPREVFGARVAQYADPDGLVFSVGEAGQAEHIGA